MFSTLRLDEYAFLNEDMRFNLLYPLIQTEHSALKSSDGKLIYVISKNIMVLYTEDDDFDKYNELLFLINRYKITKLFSSFKGLKNYQLKKTLISYCCDKAIKPNILGMMLNADERHVEIAAQLIEKFDKEVFDDVSNDKDYLYISKALIKQKCVFLWQDKEPVSMCIVLSKNNRFARLNYIYTTEDKRSRGYAKMLVYELVSSLLKDNCIPVLYTDKKNLCSNAVYSKIGFRALGEIYEYDLY